MPRPNCFPRSMRTTFLRLGSRPTFRFAQRAGFPALLVTGARPSAAEARSHCGDGAARPGEPPPRVIAARAGPLREHVGAVPGFARGSGFSRAPGGETPWRRARDAGDARVGKE